MKLYRNLFFVLLALLVVGIVLVCLVCPQSVMSRIATGLITGAFVGAINTFVNYVHLRASFFDSLSRKLLGISLHLGRDYLASKDTNAFLGRSSSTDIISFYAGRRSEIEKDIVRFERQYSNVDDLCNIYSFAPLFPWEKGVKSTIELIKQALDQIKLLPGLFETCQNFQFMSFEEGQFSHDLADAIFDVLIQSNKNLETIMNLCLGELGFASKILGVSSPFMSPDTSRRFRYIDDKICQPYLSGDPMSHILNEGQETSSEGAGQEKTEE